MAELKTIQASGGDLRAISNCTIQFISSSLLLLQFIDIQSHNLYNNKGNYMNSTTEG
jgi:hypothetical protein